MCEFSCKSRIPSKRLDVKNYEKDKKTYSKHDFYE